MKTKLINTLCALALLPMVALSQKDTLRFEINGNDVIILTDDINKLSTTDINGMIREITKESQSITKDFNERVNELNRQLNDGEIDEEAYEAKMEMEAERFEVKMEALGEMMEKWGESYGEKWEKWAEEYSESWEEWADNWADESEDMNGNIPPVPAPPKVPEFKDDDETTIIIGPNGIKIEDGTDDDIRIEYKKKSKERNKPRTVGQGDIHFGWNTMLEDGLYQVLDEPGELRPWQSTYFTLGGASKTRIGGNNSIFHIRYGLQFNWHHFRLKGNNVIAKTANPDGIDFVPISAINPEITNVSFSSFNVAYMDVPIMFILDFSKGRMDEGFSLGLGGYGGLRIAQKRNLIYDDFNNDPVKERIRNDFYMNTWRYGLMAQIGIHAFKITAKYDLNQFFNAEKATPDYQLASLGLGFSF